MVRGSSRRRASNGVGRARANRDGEREHRPLRRVRWTRTRWKRPSRSPAPRVKRSSRRSPTSCGATTTVNLDSSTLCDGTPQTFWVTIQAAEGETFRRGRVSAFVLLGVGRIRVAVARGVIR
jgi:hypothetical protein